MRQIISLNYNTYIVSEKVEGTIISILSQLIPVNKEGYGAEAIYMPDNKGIDLQVNYVRDDQVRPLTGEEIESKKFESLKYKIESLESQNLKMTEEKKELERVNVAFKALCEEKEKETT